mgnify:CR=1 FL=1
MKREQRISCLCRHRKENLRKNAKQEDNANHVNRNYKDTLFRALFAEKKHLLSLYNAVNGTDYTQRG